MSMREDDFQHSSGTRVSPLSFSFNVSSLTITFAGLVEEHEELV